MLAVGQRYYCATDREVDLMMRLFEKNGCYWRSRKPLRSQYQSAPIIYEMDTRKEFGCLTEPDSSYIRSAIHVSKIQNKIISELRR